MTHALGAVALVVREYDEAITFYVETLGFHLVEDTAMPAQNKRWVVVAPPGSRGAQLLLARAVGAEQSSRIGNQTGGRVFLFLHTDDCWRDYRRTGAKECSSCATRLRKATARWRSFRTSTATCGIWCNAKPERVEVGDLGPSDSRTQPRRTVCPPRCSFPPSL